MTDEINQVIEVVDLVESQDLKQFFMDLYAKSKGRDWFLALPRSLDEKVKLDTLEKAGLLSIENGEFRMSFQGRVRGGEFICSMTNLGSRAAALIEMTQV